MEGERKWRRVGKREGVIKERREIVKGLRRAEEGEEGVKR